MSSTLSPGQRMYEMLMESQYWPPATMLEYQRSQLGQLLKHARAHVPFYKNRLDPVFRENGELNWDRWHEIPIVTRADLRDRREEMLATQMPPGHGSTKTYHSSGSSGVPIAIEATAIWAVANGAAGRRFYEQQGMDPAKARATFSSVNAAGSAFHEEYYLARTPSRPVSDADALQDIVINRRLSETRTLDLLESKGVSYAVDITNNIEVLARANLKRKKPIRLEVILGFGQGLTAEQRNLFRESFGARSLSTYSSEEGGLMACQCGESFHYHINAEIGLVEMLSAGGKAGAPGEAGRVIVTPFFSTALPLIRYDQGDTAEFLPPCACGSELPVIGNITGRQDQFMQFPGGRRSAAGLNQKMLRENLNALAFQLAQVETFKIELRFVPARPGLPIDADQIVAHLRQLIHPELDVVFKPVDKMPLNPGGKFQRIVSEIPPQN